MPCGAATHPHRTCSKSKAVQPQTTQSESSSDSTSSQPPSKRSWKSNTPASTRSDSEQVSALLGLDAKLGINVQEAFGSLPNAHEILGTASNSIMDKSEGEMAFRRVHKKLHHPTPSVSRSLGAATISPEAYSQLTEPFALGAAVDACLKLGILKGLFIPFKVLLASNKGLTVNQYLRNPFLSPEKDSKLWASFPVLSIERWTDAFLIYMHFYCLRFLDQRTAMHKYMHIIQSMEQSAPHMAWMGYDREFHVLRHSDPSLPWHALHSQPYFSHIARTSSFAVQSFVPHY